MIYLNNNSNLNQANNNNPAGNPFDILNMQLNNNQTNDSNNQKKDYKLLLVIDKEYKYVIYTDINNTDINSDLYAIKIKEFNNNEETIPIDDNELKMIENKLKELIDK